MERRADQAARVLASGLLLFAALAGCGPKPKEAATRIPPGLASRFYPPPGWAWGWLRAPGAPPLRYGVAPAVKAARAQVLILPDAGEPVETWYEAANRLTAAGATVWALDGPGQGGSQRYALTGDRLYAPSPAVGVRALRAMVDQVVRPTGKSPLIVIASGARATAALQAASDGLPGVDGMVLTSPALLPAPSAPLNLPRASASVAARLGLARFAAPGARSWRDDGARQVRTRADVGQSWMRNNPPLRTGGETWGWIASQDQTLSRLKDDPALARISTPVRLILGRDESARAFEAAAGLCRRLPDCSLARIADAGAKPYLETDAAQETWLAQVVGFIGNRSRSASRPAAPARSVQAGLRGRLDPRRPHASLPASAPGIANAD